MQDIIIFLESFGITKRLMLMLTNTVMTPEKIKNALIQLLVSLWMTTEFILEETLVAIMLINNRLMN
jgi:hypothetical protein